MAKLPTKFTKGVLEFERSTWLVYGPPGIGKSTLAHNFPNCLFGITERTQDHLKVQPFYIESWDDYMEMLVLLKSKDGRRFLTVTLDTIDLLYKMCQEWAGNKWGFEHPGDEGHGKGWDKVNSTFHQGILKLKQLRKTVLFLAHYKEREVKARGASYQKTLPNMTGSCHKVITRESDVIAFCDFDPDKADRRVFRYVPELELEAKDRGGVFPLKPGYLRLDYTTIRKAWGTGPGPRVEKSKFTGNGPTKVKKGAVRKGGKQGPRKKKKKGPRRKS